MKATIENLFESFHFTPQDTMWVFSHGGLNAAPVEAALYAKNRGLSVVAVTSVANQKIARATHSSGKKLSDIADVVIDKCVRPEDALVAVDGWPHPLSAGSTVAVVAASMTVLSEVALRLANQGAKPPVFVSPNVNPDVRFNDTVFEAHRELLRKL